jgi:hypothetical protein
MMFIKVSGIYFEIYAKQSAWLKNTFSYFTVIIYIYRVPTETWTVSNYIYIHNFQKKKKTKKKMEQVPLQGHTACTTNFYGSRKPLVITAWANKVSVIISTAAHGKQCAEFTVFF